MCEVCSKMVLSHNIKLHMKNHEEKQITCPKCPRKFRWNSSLTSHLSSAHGDQVKTVTSACEFCGKQFKDKSNLRQHRYSHTGGPYSCKTCGRGFGRKDLLKSHQSKCNPIVSATANILFQWRLPKFRAYCQFSWTWSNSMMLNNRKRMKIGFVF